MDLNSNCTESPRRRFISVREAADYLGLSVNTLYSWNSQGLYLPVIKFGRRSLVDTNDLEAFIAASKKQPRPADVPEGRSRGRIQ